MNKEEKQKKQIELKTLIDENISLKTDYYFVDYIISNEKINVVKNVLCFDINMLSDLKESINKKIKENASKIETLKLELIENWIENKRLKAPLLSDILTMPMFKTLGENTYLVKNLQNLLVCSDKTSSVSFRKKLFNWQEKRKNFSEIKGPIAKIDDTNKDMWKVLFTESIIPYEWRHFILEEITTKEVVALEIKVR